MPYVKLDTDTLNSSLWVSDYRTRITFLTMLMMAKPDGTVPAKAPGIARAAVLPVEDVRKAIEELESPDPDSRTEEDEGRRIRKIDGGFEIINYLKYREKDYTAAERMRRYRARKKESNGRNENTDVTAVTGNVTQAEAEAEVKKKNTVHLQCTRFDDFWSVWPNKKGKQDARKAWKSMKCDRLADQIIDHVSRRKKHDPQWTKEGGKFIPLPATFIRGERWEDEWESGSDTRDPMEGVL